MVRQKKEQKTAPAPQENGSGWRWQPAPGDPVRVGISACLLGQKVRYDGGHKRDGFLVDTFGRFLEWVPVCPEVEVGMGVPRPAIRLQRGEGEVRLVDPKNGKDWTEPMLAYAQTKVEALAGLGLCGFVLKKDSPSCGMERVKVYGGGMPRKEGVGLFARVLMARFPHLPVEEEGRLCDPRLRENFVERVFAYHRLQRLLRGGFRVGDLVAFHTAHKLRLMAHDPKLYQELGRLVAGAKALPREVVAERYTATFMSCLRKLATRPRHTNVLQHMAGYFKDRLGKTEKQELAELIRDYYRGLVPLVVPLTLVRHYVRLLDVHYLAGQTYLEPHPKELMLRNHV